MNKSNYFYVSYSHTRGFGGMTFECTNEGEIHFGETRQQIAKRNNFNESEVVLISWQKISKAQFNSWNISPKKIPNND